MKTRILTALVLPAVLALAQTTGAPGAKPAAQTSAPAAKPQTTPRPAARSGGTGGARITAATVEQMKYPPLRPVQIPAVDSSTLPNGMKLYLLEDHELPLINGTALIRTGNLFDPKEKVGLATLTGTVLRSGGTKAKTGDQLDEELENIAASVETSIGETRGSLNFSALKGNADEVLAVVKDVLASPEFRLDKVELAKTQLRSGISRRNDDAHGIQQREFANIVYGRDNPYGWMMEYDTVDRIARDDLLAFYRRYFFPANLLFAVRGDFVTADMKTKIQKLFADWTVAQPPVPEFPKVPGKPAPGIFAAAKNDVTQTFLSIGQLGGEFRDRDYPALEVMAAILGGGFQSRLFKKVRTELGYAYDIGASWGANYDHPGLFEISGSTKGVSAVETVKAIDEELARIRTAEVSDAELRVAKDTALNGFVFAFDTKAKTLGRLLTYEYFGYPKDFIYQYQKALAAVTKADVLRVAKEHIKPSELTVVAVGKLEDLRPLEKLGAPMTVIDLKIPEPKPQAAPADASSLQKGKELLARAQQAAGGADKLAAVTDLTQSGDYLAEPGGMKASQTTQWLAPLTFRQENQLPTGSLVIFWDAKIGWKASGKRNASLSSAEAKQCRGEVFRLYLPLLLSDRDPDRTVSYVGDNAVAISDKSGNSVRLYVDESSGLPRKVTYQVIPLQGPPAQVEDELGDFKEVGGIKLPFRVTITQGGRKAAEVVIREYKLNAGLKAEELRKYPE